MSSTPRGSGRRALMATSLAAPIVFALMLSGCAGAGGDGGDIAQVGDQKIPRSDFETKLEGVPQAKQVLLQLIQTALIEQYATKNKIDISDADIDKKLTDIKSKYPPGQFDSMVKQQGLDDAGVRKILRDQLIISQATQTKVSDADVKAYLDKNHATLDLPAQVQAKHILVADEATAEMIEGKLKSGGDFAALAKQYSTDPSTKDKGGDLGLFGKGQMVPTFSAAAFSQPIGVVGPPVKSPFGYHIIEVEKRNPPQIATLANSGDKIRTQLQQQQSQQNIPLFLERLQSQTDVKIFDDKLKDALPPAAAAPAGAAGAGAAPATAPSPAASK